ncbi:MAG: hypothetical protein JNJ88_17445 [Planctomycetes bacterium]|nr:hypothetical protein [Planctomycetota bacterium]
MRIVNRYLALVRCRQPHVDWTKTLPNSDVIASLGEEPRAYLLAENPRDDLDLALAESWMRIFECELYAWHTDENAWPRARTRELFEWFEVTLASTVEDLSPVELEVEEFDI